MDARTEEPPDNQEPRARAFRRMRALATTLLAAMALLYLLARWAEGWHPAVAFVRAFAEAAMVGALADWFAVTALFRHPLGVPIPHTAIVPRNKDRIGHALGRFVANNFLEPTLLHAKLRQADLAGRLAAWLIDPQRSVWLAHRLARAIPALLSVLNDAHVREMLRHVAAERLRSAEAAPLVAGVLGVLVDNGQHRTIYEHLVAGVGDFLTGNRDLIRRKVTEHSRRWVPGWVDEKVFAAIMSGVEGFIAELRDPDGPWPKRFDDAVRQLVEDVRTSPDQRARIEAAKGQVLDNPQVQAYVDVLLSRLHDHLRAELLADPAELARGSERMLLAVGRWLERDRDMRQVINGWMEGFLLDHLVPHRHEIGNYIAETVHRWDTRTIVAKLELQFGRDLQYIRINGTLVGGGVGVLLHTIDILLR